jgi:hypothetical protein
MCEHFHHGILSMSNSGDKNHNEKRDRKDRTCPLEILLQVLTCHLPSPCIGISDLKDA